MLYWFCKFQAYELSRRDCWAMAREAIRYNRLMGRSIYHAVRVGDVIVGD